MFIYVKLVFTNDLKNDIILKNRNMKGMYMKKIYLFIVTFILTFCLVGCAKDLSTEVFRFEVRELEMNVGTSKNIWVILGQTSKKHHIVFDVLLKDEAGNYTDSKFDNDYLTVKGTSTTVNEFDTLDSSDLRINLTAKQAGTVKLYAYVKEEPNINDYILLTILNDEVKSMTLSSTLTGENHLLEVGKSTQMTCTFLPNGINGEVIYSTSNPDYLTISETGLVKAIAAPYTDANGKKNGGATVNVIATLKDDPSFSCIYPITVKYPATSVKATVSVMNRNIGEVVNVSEFGFYVMPRANTVQDIRLSVTTNNNGIYNEETGDILLTKAGTISILGSNPVGSDVSVKINIDYKEGTSIVISNTSATVENNEVTLSDSNEFSFDVSLSEREYDEILTKENFNCSLTNSSSFQFTIEDTATKGVFKIKIKYDGDANSSTTINLSLAKSKLKTSLVLNINKRA